MSPSRPTKSKADGQDQSLSFLTLKLPKSSYAPRYWPSWLWLFFLRFTAMLPLAWSRALGAGLGLLMMTNKKRRRIARINLELCFPKLSLREREHLLRRHFIVSGQSYFDLAYLAWASERRLLRKTHFRGLEQYHAFLHVKAAARPCGQLAAQPRTHALRQFPAVAHAGAASGDPRAETGAGVL